MLPRKEKPPKRGAESMKKTGDDYDQFATNTLCVSVFSAV